MPKNKLPISINICTYNEERDISDCLDRSIENFPAEIIVIDGGSTDATISIAKSKGVRVISSKKPGLSSQRQDGIEASTQPYIAIIDADDHLDSNFLQTLYDEMNKYQYDALLGREVAYKPKTYWERAMGGANHRVTYTKKPIDSNMIGRPALYRSEAIKSCGFDSFFDGVGCEDMDLSIRMEKAGFKQGIGTGLTQRKQSVTFLEIVKKIIKYGKGDAHISYKYQSKLSKMLFHQLIRYPIIRSYQAARFGDGYYIPFFIMYGIGRFLSMFITLVKLYIQRPILKKY